MVLLDLPSRPRGFRISRPIPPRSVDFAVERRNDRTLARFPGSYANRGNEACEVHSDDAKGTHNLPVNSRALCRLSYVSKTTVAGLEPATP